MPCRKPLRIPVDARPSTKRVLMVAFHYPPAANSSGWQRTLSFTRHLPSHEWLPAVLTAHPRAHVLIRNDQLADVPETVPVVRTYALDAARHLSLLGKYPRFLALPDRWVNWCLSAVPAGLRMIRRLSPQLIWSTYPIATSHLIAWLLHRFTGLPWVADFRDPMVEKYDRTGELFPAEDSIRHSRLWIEQKCVRHASRLVFCTPGARTVCAERYPGLKNSRLALIPNGYDEQLFSDVERSAKVASRPRSAVQLVHSGLLYSGSDRDPTGLFDALAQLQKSGTLDLSRIRIVLRASGQETVYREAIESRRLGESVILAPSVPYRQAIAEMLAADGLLLFQGYCLNKAIPAKLYEYFRAGKPILALVDEEGDTAKLLRELQCGVLVPLHDSERIGEGLLQLLAQIQQGSACLPRNRVAEFSREAGTAKLASVLDECLRDFRSDSPRERC